MGASVPGGTFFSRPVGIRIALQARFALNFFASLVSGSRSTARPRRAMRAGPWWVETVRCREHYGIPPTMLLEEATRGAMEVDERAKTVAAIIARYRWTARR